MDFFYVNDVMFCVNGVMFYVNGVTFCDICAVSPATLPCTKGFVLSQRAQRHMQVLCVN